MRSTLEPKEGPLDVFRLLLTTFLVARSAVRNLALWALLLALFALDYARTQSLYSPYPSRSTILALADRPRDNATVANHIRTHTATTEGSRTVLGFVAPWNPRGTGMAERYRGKFDIISPAWHTVDVINRDQADVTYSIGGGSTGKADDEWRRRMQRPAKDGNGKTLPPVNISPRFVLDRFTAEDILQLLQTDRLLEAMAHNVFDAVMEHDYDGVVLECAAVWAIEKLVQILADKLHGQGKTLTVVLPSVRDSQSEDAVQTNAIAVHAMKTLSPIADHVVVMTYDHSGRQGRAYADIHDVAALPDGSPLAQDGVRMPGPNTPLSFLQRNLEQLTAELETVGDSGQFAVPGFGSPSFSGAVDVKSADTLLIGLPMYGYTYSIGWFDNTAVAQNSVPRVPPVAPLMSKDNDTQAHAAARAKAESREAETASVVPVLRFAGEAFKHDDLEAQLQASKALIRLDDDSQEQYFDYVAKLPESVRQRLATQNQTTVDDKQASYFRAYFPSAHTMRERFRVISEWQNVGIALWDLGQAGEWLLHEL